MSAPRQPQQQNSYDHKKYYNEDAIVALSTGGGGAIAIIRTSGKNTFEFSQKLLPFLDLTQNEEKKVYKTKIVKRNETCLDEAVLIKFNGPRSYTGEDLLEFHVHASPFIIHTLIEELIACGHRHALPGEFSFRAVRSGKLSLSQAEAVSDLIQSQNENALSLALEKLSGSQLKLVSQLAEELKQIAIFSEVSMDFSDQGIEEVSLEQLKLRLKKELLIIYKLMESFKRGQCIQNGVRISFLGLPNAGKSSLFNALLGDDRAIVSEIAGTTRDTIKEKLTLTDGKRSATFIFEDTAGVRSTQDIIEKKGVDKTWKSVSNAACVLLLIDPQLMKESELEEILFELKKFETEKIITIFTKTDLWNKNSIELKFLDILEKNNFSNIVYTSAEKESGIKELISLLLSVTHGYVSREKEELVITKQTHFLALQSAAQHFERALNTSESDLFAADVREGILELAPLIGETLPEDILEQIFSQFCIGK